MSLYARGTSTPVDRTEGEIKRTLLRYGADDVVTGTSGRLGQAFVQFLFRGLPVRIQVPVPSVGDERFWKSPGGRRKRSDEAAQTEWTKACRQQWRILLLLIKAQMEAVLNGLMPAHEAFLPWLMLPNGRTVTATLGPQVEKALKTGQLKMLPFGGEEARHDK